MAYVPKPESVMKVAPKNGIAVTALTREQQAIAFLKCAYCSESLFLGGPSEGEICVGIIIYEKIRMHHV